MRKCESMYIRALIVSVLLSPLTLIVCSVC